MSIALAMITKNTAEEAGYLDACLSSVTGHVDEICVTVTKSSLKSKTNPTMVQVLKKHNAKASEFKWVDDFAAARNFSFAQTKADFILWLDADDILIKGEKLRTICDNTPPHVNAIYVNYDYEVDEDGTVKTKHWRERILRNDGSLIWKGRIHETPVETRRGAKARNEEINVQHTSKPERWDESTERNIRILTAQINDEADNPDPRTMFYLASAYKARGALEQATNLLEMYLKLSGWDEERCMAWCSLAEIHLAHNRDPEAIECYLQAIKEREDMPVPYIGLGEIYAYAGKNGKAVNWLKMALSKPEPSTSMLINPLLYTYRPLIVMAECQFSEGQINEALANLHKAKAYKDDEGVRGLIEFYSQIKGHKLATESVTGLARFLEINNQEAKIPSLIEAIPDQLQDNPAILRLKKSFSDPITWPAKSVVIFTGASVLGEWGPWSLAEGIGGSEEAIIRLSKRLKEQGYSVTIYATPGAQAGEYDGIQWRNYWELDTRDSYDVFVAWRSPWFFDAKIKARKKYLWLHDVMEQGEFTPERLAELDKVIVLSEYHRSLFPNIPDDKIFLSANGIDADEFELAELEGPYVLKDRVYSKVGSKPRVKRDPHLVVYQSSHVRGLSHVYDVWPDVLKAVPDAKLRVMYGWQSFINVHRNNPERMEWMEMMKKRTAELQGVEDIGKVGMTQIMEEILSAGVWAYPCPFPEISCITAMKAQAGGAVPVASNYAALAETIQWGVKMELPEWNDDTKKAYKNHLIQMLKDTDYQENIRKVMMPGARKAFSWTNVAKQWIENFES